MKNFMGLRGSQKDEKYFSFPQISHFFFTSQLPLHSSPYPDGMAFYGLSHYKHMKRGVAFIRGVGMYGSKNYTRQQILQCLQNIQSDDMAIIGMDGADNVIFETNGHYATVGRRIEQHLERCFGEPFSVTTRSMETVRRIVGIYG